MALVSAPWPLYSRPSIQLGALKAYLESRISGLRVDSLHLYLRVADAIGFEVYQSISERSWLAELVYGALLFPERRDSIERLFGREAKGKAIFRGLRFEELIERVRVATDAFIEDEAWDELGLAGFSVCLCQLTASLFLIKRIKALHGGLRIVAGGSAWVGDSCAAWLKHFPEIDYIIVGEGELPLLELVSHLQLPPGNRLPLTSPAIVARGASSSSDCPALQQLEDLGELPMPDYDDYFKTLERLPSGRSFFPTVPVEASRGCWWRRPTPGGGRGGCAFCNLNLQWEGYRSKSPDRVVAEVDELTTRHRTLVVAFTDNVLPFKDIPEIFGGLSTLGKDFHLFAEIRAAISPEALTAMREAGVEEVQVGIEALSTRLLARMNKGSTTIQNIQTMKFCEELSVANRSNLIIGFPGSGEAEVAETLNALEFVQVYRPLRTVRFWLGLDSPVYRSPRSYGIRAVFNHPWFAAILPDEVFREARLMVQGYRADLRFQRKLWRPVVERMESWEAAYETMKRASGGKPPLSYREGRDFLLIHQFRPGQAALHHRMTGASRGIYLCCRIHRSLDEVAESFPKLSRENIRTFLQGMVEKKLMFREGDRFLSLAVALRAERGRAAHFEQHFT